jgi:hypothetical protein
MSSFVTSKAATAVSGEAVLSSELPDPRNAELYNKGPFPYTSFFERYVKMYIQMQNAVFWDIKPQFVLRRRHNTSPLQCHEG